MGQYYKPIILDDNKQIKVWFDAHSCDNGLKLMEHSYLGNDFVATVMRELVKPARLVWAGDYADNEEQSKEEAAEEEETNLYHRCEPDTEFHGEWSTERKADSFAKKYCFAVNHDRKEFVSLENLPADKDGLTIHPVPLLCSEGNGAGGGDYHGTSEKYVGTWARNLIQLSTKAPEGYVCIKPDFMEE